MYNLSWQKFIEREEFFAEFPRIPLVYLWSQRELRSTASVMVGLTRNTVGRVFAMLRYYCKRNLQDRPIIPFGGRVFVVECDESQFKHKLKVSQQTSNSTRIYLDKAKSFSKLYS